ncbi:DotA/TraY family protein [Stutzerimonas stutzeri]|uniref:DotA/TraY family protein n=1 Tax=Stutzerimonas stutzeri TaxID=316 RepID=UPI0015E2E389|nr:DotA/TraY family protein [Stutzerimonas stutzeri]MBA1280240.1 DotA/TraY family protein [Stutzerimonas stutzeri]
MKTQPRATHLFSALLVVLGMVLLTGSAFGQVPEIPPGTVAQIDELNQLNYSSDFGQKAIDWISHGSDSPTFGDKSLLSVISLSLNAIALAMMAWLAIIGGATYVAQTANKGVPGGQVISSFWAPIRIATATILLIPLGSGFSTLQYGVITVAEKGNAHGTYLMGVGLDYLYDFGSYRAPGIPDGKAVVYSLIGSEVCRQYINSYTGKETITPVYSEGKQGDSFVAKVAYRYNEAPTWSHKNNPRNDYCGAVGFSIEHNDFQGKIWRDELAAKDGAPRLVAQGQLALLKKMQALATPIAQSILSDEKALRALQSQGESQQSTYQQAVAQLNGVISGAAQKTQEAILAYNSESQKIIVNAVNTISDAKNAHNGSSGWREQTMAMGWPALGTIFWQINVNQSEINKLAASFGSDITDPNVDEEWLADERFVEVSTRIQGLVKLHASIENSQPAKTNQTMGQPDSIPSLSAIGDAGAEGDGWVDNLKSTIYEGFAAGIKSMLFKNTPDDLIINMQYFGSGLSTLAEVGWWAKTIKIGVSRGLAESWGRAASDVSNKVSGIPVLGWMARAGGATTEGAAKGFSFALQDVSQMLNYLILALVVVGFTLGVVLPTIPLFIWLMGVISWMLFFIECLLVSPMWMAAHGTAEKEGWGSEHTRQGYMLMIGLYLNPILRVAGFFAVFAALKPLAWLVSWYFDYVQGVVVSGFVFIFMILGSLMISAIFAYSAIVRVFGLPSELFERGLRWINGGQEVTGDSQGEKEGRGNIGAFVNKSEGAAAHTRKKDPGLGVPSPTDMPTASPIPGGKP